MAIPSVVAVYGRSDRERRPQRLGGGTLEGERVVTLDQDLVRQLTSNHPPEVLRVGIAGVVGGEPFVEVIEVRQVVQSDTTDMWAVELWAPAESPTIWETRSIEAGSPTGPMNGLCYLFPRLSFC